MKSWTTNKNLPVTRQTAFLISPTYLLRLLWIVYDSKDRIFEISFFYYQIINVIILSLILFRRVVRLSSLLTLLGGSSE